jgi:Zn-dependent protease with chaperone function
VENDAKTAQTVNEKAFLDALFQPIKRVKVPLRYRLAMVLVVVVMVLLPILYLTLIAGLGWLVWWHATTNIDIVGMGSGRGKLGAFMLYGAPIFAGVVAILFMLKPVLIRPPKPPANLKLDAKSQPLLFRLVERLCQTLGAPKPRAIEIDCDVNASARLNRGIRSFFSKDLTLTIGLPVAAGLTMQQFVGVLAHEFGHFAQGGAMRLNYLVGSINAWFFRVVYERDRWDEKLENAVGSDSGWYTALTIAVTRGVVWLSRRILWVLMHVGHAISCLLMRQMEFDADRYQARIAGCNSLEKTFIGMHLHGAGSQGAFMELERQWAEQRLGNNLPKLVHQHAFSLPKELVDHIKVAIHSERTGWFATHPADRDRIDKAMLDGADGIFRFTEPASLLFRDFDGLCERATRHHYREFLGIDLKGIELASSETMMADHQAAVEGGQAAEQLFHGAVLGLRRLPFKDHIDEPPEDPARAREEMKQAREQMERGAASAARCIEKYREGQERLWTASRVEGVIRAGYKVKPTEYGLSASTEDAVDLALASARRLMDSAEARLQSHMEMAGVRVSGAMQFLRAPLFQVRHPEAEELAEETFRLAMVLEPLAQTCQPLLEVECLMNRLGGIFEKVDSHGESEDLTKQAFHARDQLYAHLKELRITLGGVAYPFNHAAGSIALSDAVLEHLPHREDFAGVTGAAENVVSTLVMLYSRVIGRLCHTTLRVERWLGIGEVKN